MPYLPQSLRRFFKLTHYRLSNGDLLVEEERAGFDVLLTADKNIRHQQNLRGHRIAIVVLGTPQWPVVRLHIERIAAVVNAATPGSYTEVNLVVE